MLIEIQNFITFIHQVKKASRNTELSYQRDLMKLAEYLEDQGITEVSRVTKTSLQSYILEMENQGKAPTTISRSIASMKAFFAFALEQGYTDHNPASTLKPPRVERKIPGILSVEDMDRLLSQPSADTPKEIRDKAMLELLYATGIRVSELISLKQSDVNMELRYIQSMSHGHMRMIPFGSAAYKALKNYLENGRPALIRSSKDEMLFVNCSGGAMSRQGFWKIIKYYSYRAGIEVDITPHTLRHSFAVHMISGGADLRAVQEMLGHSDISTTQRYVSMVRDKEWLKASYEAHPRK